MNVPTTPSAAPAIRYSTVDDGTKCDRSADAPAAALKKISSATCVSTCTDCCSATAAVARKVDALNKLLEARNQLSNLVTYMDGKTGAEELLARVLDDPALLQSLAATAKQAEDGGAA